MAGAAGGGNDLIRGGGNNDIIFGDGFSGSIYTQGALSRFMGYIGYQGVNLEFIAPGGQGGFGGGGGGAGTYANEDKANELHDTLGGAPRGGIGGGNGGYMKAGEPQEATASAITGAYGGQERSGAPGQYSSSGTSFGGGGGAGAGGTDGGDGGGKFQPADGSYDAVPFDAPVRTAIPHVEDENTDAANLYRYDRVVEKINFDGREDDQRVWGSQAQTQGAGNDIIHGEGGNDILIGGGGDDIFVIDFAKEKNNAIERILDWGHGGDRLRIEHNGAAVDANAMAVTAPADEAESGNDGFGDYLQYGFAYGETKIVFVRLYTHHDGENTVAGLLADMEESRSQSVDANGEILALVDG